MTADTTPAPTPAPSLLASVITGKRIKPPKVFAYGPFGVGKNTFAASMPTPIILQAEEGSDNLGTARFPLATSFRHLLEQIRTLGTEDHGYQTAVLDTADWTEKLIEADVCHAQNAKSIEDIPYGKGHEFALDRWEELKSALGWLRDTRNMLICILAHCEIKRYDNPETESYDKYFPKLHRKAWPFLVEWCDACLFLNYKHFVVQEDVGFNKKVKRAIGSGERVIYTTERPSHIAKNRYHLPSEIAFPESGAWDLIQAGITKYAQEAKAA